MGAFVVLMAVFLHRFGRGMEYDGSASMTGEKNFGKIFNQKESYPAWRRGFFYSFTFIDHSYPFDSCQNSLNCVKRGPLLTVQITLKQSRIRFMSQFSKIN